MLSFRPLLTGPRAGCLGKACRTLVAARIVFQPSSTPSPCATSLHSSSLASNSDAHNVDPASEQEVEGEAVVPLRAVKGKSTRNSVRHFVDWKAVTVYGGDGGDGGDDDRFIDNLVLDDLNVVTAMVETAVGEGLR